MPAGDRNREDPLCRRSVVGQVQDEGYTSTLCRCHYDGCSDTWSDELTTTDAQCHQDALQTKSKCIARPGIINEAPKALQDAPTPLRHAPSTRAPTTQPDASPYAPCPWWRLYSKRSPKRSPHERPTCIQTKRTTKGRTTTSTSRQWHA